MSTFDDEIQDFRYALGELMIAILREFKAPVNFIIRCLLKVCDWLEDE